LSFLDAVITVGDPLQADTQAAKKRFSERLSRALAEEVADGARATGFKSTKPTRGGVQEKEFEGGLGPKKVDVSFADERNGLMLAVSIKTISFEPFGKNLKNRFGDLCAEAITLHMRFPYSVVCALFAFPILADRDTEKKREISTFKRASRLVGTMSGRTEYTDPPEKFENVTMLLYQPMNAEGVDPSIRLIDSKTGRELTEREYFEMLRSLFESRNPHYAIAAAAKEIDTALSE